MKLCHTSLVLLAASPAHADVIYVDASAAGADDGTSWRDAFVDLQDALAVVSSIDEIWVAEGVYRPTSSGDRRAAFVIDGRRLYGGFDGTESNRADREGTLERTVLTGDLAGDDGPGFTRATSARSASPGSSVTGTGSRGAQIRSTSGT